MIIATGLVMLKNLKFEIMKEIDFSKMEAVGSIGTKEGVKTNANQTGNCYECDSSDCDGGWCDCNDGGSDE